MTRDFDVAVIGGGPAGAAAAITAADRGASVVLFEARTDVIDKPCGEGLMPEGVSVLEALGLGDVARAGRTFKTLTFFIGGRRAIDIPLDMPGSAIERPILQTGLDRELARRPSITCIRRRAAASVDGAAFRVSDAAGRFVRSAALVLADGLSGASRSFVSAPELSARGGRLGVRARFQAGKRPLAGVEIHMGGGAEVYLTPLTDGVVNVAALASERTEAGTDAKELLDRLLIERPEVMAALGTLRTAPEARWVRCRARKTIAGPGFFFAGDAAVAVDPIVGCGVTLALASGRMAGNAAADHAFGREPSAVVGRYEDDYDAISRDRMRIARGLIFLSRHPAVLSAAAMAFRAAPRAARYLARTAGRSAS